MADPAIVAEGLGTTTVRILATLLKPDRGRAWAAGFDVTSNPAAVRRLIGVSGQYAAVDPFLTGQENLVMIGRLYGPTRRQAHRRAGDLIDVLELASAANGSPGGSSSSTTARSSPAAHPASSGPAPEETGWTCRPCPARTPPGRCAGRAGDGSPGRR